MFVYTVKTDFCFLLSSFFINIQQQHHRRPIERCGSIKFYTNACINSWNRWMFICWFGICIHMRMCVVQSQLEIEIAELMLV